MFGQHQSFPFQPDSMSGCKEADFSLRVVINEEKTKVLFAEADNDFADMLLNFLLLPLGKIVEILEKHFGDQTPLIGSLTTLHKGLANPDIVNFWTDIGKRVLDKEKGHHEYCNLKVSIDYNVQTSYKFGQPYDGVFTPNAASFIISDDLRIVPNVTGSVMQTLSKLGFDIADMSSVEIRTVTFGLKEIIELLKGSLISRNPLSDLILSKRTTKQVKFATVDSEAGILSNQIEKEAFANSQKMILKVMFQKSSGKLLFAQAYEDFVDFLFSILVIPLGRVEWLLGSNTCLNNIDNLYRSLADLAVDKHFKGSGIKDQLMKPNIPDTYASGSFLHAGNASGGFLHVSSAFGSSHNVSRHSDQVGRRFFVEGSRMYMVTDDLTVTRLVVSSSIYVLNEMKTPLSDVQEVEFQIGFEEAIRILKASLTSTYALTDGLITPRVKQHLMLEFMDL